MINSAFGNTYSGSRCAAESDSFLLSLYLATTPKNVCTILGLQLAKCRGEAYEY